MKHVDIGRGRWRLIFPCHVSIILLLASISKIRSRYLLLGSLPFGSTTFEMTCVDRVTRDFQLEHITLLGALCAAFGGQETWIFSHDRPLILFHAVARGWFHVQVGH